MKLITFLVPCYNSQDYMQKCIDSLLSAGEDAEIIIVDDGSKDNTAVIADGYAEKYPEMVKAVHQPNGGHRYDSQLRVMNCMINAFTYEYLCSQPKGLKKYLKHSLNAIMANTLYFTCGKDGPERRAGLKEMWQSVKVKDKKMYRFLRYHTYAAILMPLPWKLRGGLAGFFYKMLCKVVKLG